MKTLFNRWHLTYQFTQRDVEERYRGSILGVGLSLVRPILMLTVYFLVFGLIFEGKMTGHPSETRLDFVLSLFCGLILFEFFAEVLSSSPGLITSRPNLVTKVLFPLEILPMVRVLSSFFHLGIACIPLIVIVAIIHAEVPWCTIFLPFVLTPLLLITFGLASLFSALGVFLRDLHQLLPNLTVALMFASAIFYPLNKVPDSIAWLIHLNPLAHIIEQARKTIVWNEIPNIETLGILTLIGLVMAFLGWFFFMKTKPMFADVI